MNNTNMEVFHLMKKSDRILRRANILMEELNENLSIKTLINFMVDQNPTYNDINFGIVEFLIWYLLPPLKTNNFDKGDFFIRLSQLRNFMRILLRLPEFVEYDTGILTIDQRGKDTFESIVCYLLHCLDKADTKHYYIDMFPSKNVYSPLKSHLEVNTGIWIWPSFVRVLGPSFNPLKVCSHHLTQSLRLLSIMHEANQHWPLLFSNTSTELLIHNSNFGMMNFRERYNNKSSDKSHSLCNNIIEDYSFLVPHHFRKAVYRDKVKLHENKNRDKRVHVIKISRTNLLKDATNLMKNSVSSQPFWIFMFKNEISTGLGPTKEFYSEFSRECLRFDLNLWIGDSKTTSNDGVEYLHLSTGLFPSPCIQLDDYSRQVLTTIGILMAKSQLDGMLMNMNFSKVLYKYMMGPVKRGQYLKLSDIKHVLPSLSSFIDGMVDVHKEVTEIRHDTSLTEEELSMELSNIQFDGCRLKDLSINFTVPGFPDIEMIEGGKDTILSVENVQEYLQLLVWWILYKGPQEKLECICSGYDSVMSRRYLGLLTLDDVENLFCGTSPEPWLISELEESCKVGGSLTLGSPVVKNLFEILASYSREKQEQFLKFVTCMPKLPVGGLNSLDPKLNIMSYTTSGSPNNYFPCSMTCTNTLLLPSYTSKDILEEKLATVIKYGSDKFQFV